MQKENLKRLFTDVDTAKRIKKKLPYLFQLAEADSSRAGKIGMEIGSVRERIIIALLMYKFGEKSIEMDLPITHSEADVLLHGSPVSIKTITGKRLSGIKLIWTVDAKKALEFRANYQPSCDMLLAQICWGDNGWFYYFPLEVQNSIFEKIGRENYIKLPKEGTNPRGVEITQSALELLTENKNSWGLKVFWERQEVKAEIYKKWLDLWKS